MWWQSDPSVPLDVGEWEVVSDESMGKRRKAWVRQSDDASTRALLKWARKNQPQDGTAPELWAEIVAVDVADALGVPACRVRLARAPDGTYATLSRSAVDEWPAPGVVAAGGSGQELVHGNELISRELRGYDTGKKGRVPGYSIPSVRRALAGFGSEVDGMDAFECFVGYLLLDAVIANTDRHHSNWAVLTPACCLAASFDHGTSLGFNLRSLAAADVRRFAARGATRHFEEGGTLVGLARAALDCVDPVGADAWRSRLEGLQVDTLREAWARRTGALVSEARVTVMLDLVEINRRRVLDGSA